MDHDFTLLLMCAVNFFSCSKSLLAICCITNQTRLGLNDQRDGIFMITYLTSFSLVFSSLGWQKIHCYQSSSGFFVIVFHILGFDTTSTQSRYLSISHSLADF